ncbi:MAG: alternative ribosome rescue aminoacyl-tRNA hydrolase ArfB [Acidobacteriota bacterium]
MWISEGVEIPDEEITVSFSRSSGPGGQNVNKVSSRVTLYFDLEGSGALSPEQKESIRKHLASRLSKAGILRVSSQRHRSQSANRDEARRRFAELLSDAIAGRAPRRPTRVPRAQKERRRTDKKRRSELKRNRANRGLEN